MIAVRSEDEISVLREADQMVAEVLATLVNRVEPGVSTGELDAQADAMIRELGGKPSFLGYQNYPKSTCISVESEIIHGIPGKRKLKAGEIVSIDVGVHYRGYHGDAAITVACGEVDEDRRRLMEVTDLALSRAVAAAKAGNFLVEIGRAVQTTCEAAGFSVVRQFVGHGIGTRLHEDPQIPNYVTRERGPRLRAGMVLAIEPMINMGTHRVRMLDDGWTAVTADGKPSAHFEHSVAVREHGGEILSRTPKLVWGQRTS
ncbi:MAG: methionine aminopeptidase [Candidatus Hydrogenedentota bacterium]